MGDFDSNIEKILRQQSSRAMPVQQQIDPVTPVLLKEIVEQSRVFAEQVILFAMTKDEKILDDAYTLLYGCFHPIAPQMLPIEGVKGIFFYVYLGNPVGVFKYVKHFIGEKSLIDETCFDGAQKDFDIFCSEIYNLFIKTKSASFEDMKAAYIKFAEALITNKKLSGILS